MDKKKIFDYTTRHNMPKIKFHRVRKPKYKGIINAEVKKTKGNELQFK